MKKTNIMAILLMMASGMLAQTPLDWHLQSFGPDSIWGAGINDAIKQMEGKKAVYHPVVAIISRGFDFEHEDLQEALWTNKKEIPGNGIDDDKNGYVDDIHGWNFLAAKGGKDVVYTSEVGHRMFDGVRARLEEIYNKGKQRTPEEAAEYMRLMRTAARSKLETLYMQYFMQRKIALGMEDLDRQLHEKFADCEDFTYDQFMTLAPSAEEAASDSIDNMAFYVTSMVWGFSPQVQWNARFAKRDDQWKQSEKTYQEALARYVDERDFIKDDRTKLSDCYYGNSNLLQGNSSVGTGLCGVIGATRGNDIGIDGICDAVQLMLLRAVPEGDEYDKDVAVAIQYAVNNGADIILIAAHKSITEDSKILWEALDMAERKGILVIHGVGEEPSNMDSDPSCPTGLKVNGQRYPNYINVGASMADGHPVNLSNYGKKMVDLFAPGWGIYSCDAGDNYFKLNGTNAAAAVVAGVAALIKSRMPTITAAELKRCIVETATLGKDLEVYHPMSPDAGINNLRTTFYRELCVSGGLFDADAAVRMALSGGALSLDKARAAQKANVLDVQANRNLVQALLQQKPMDKAELQEASNNLVLVNTFYAGMKMGASEQAGQTLELFQEPLSAADIKAMKLPLNTLRQTQLLFLEAKEKDNMAGMIKQARKLISLPMPTDNMCDPVVFNTFLMYIVEHGTLQQTKSFVDTLKKNVDKIADERVKGYVKMVIENAEGYIMLQEYED